MSILQEIIIPPGMPRQTLFIQNMPWNTILNTFVPKCVTSFPEGYESVKRVKWPQVKRLEAKREHPKGLEGFPCRGRQDIRKPRKKAGADTTAIGKKSVPTRKKKNCPEPISGFSYRNLMIISSEVILKKMNKT